MDKIEVVKGDITKLKVDAIVNAGMFTNVTFKLVTSSQNFI